MKYHPCKTGLFALLALLTFCALSSSAIAADAGSSPAGDHAATTTQASDVEEILQASSKFFSGFPFMRAEDVYERIVKGEDDSYFLVSVQPPDEYARGHIPGAVNIPFRDIADAASLSRLPHKKIVLSCEDGHRSMAAALFLSQLGYDTHVVSMGLSHWNRTGANVASPYPGSAGFPVSTVESVQQERYELPVVKGKSQDSRGVFLFS